MKIILPMTATPRKVNIMDCFNDPEWLEESLRIEEELEAIGGEISAGYPLGAHLGQFYQNSDRYVPMTRLRDLVMAQLNALLVERGWKEGYATGREILDRRLKNPPLDIQERLLDAVERDIQARKRSSDPTPEDVKSDIRTVILEVLTPEDWQQIEESLSAIA
ncbi:MAG: hypothetical protein AAGA60_25940 [Cyanobacteria bacterium P01_E01_bin.42]